MVYACILMWAGFLRAVQSRSFHASGARQFDFSKFSDAVTSNEARYGYRLALLLYHLAMPGSEGV